MEEEATPNTKPLSDIVHICLARDPFLRLAEEGITTESQRSIDYVADARDDLIRQIGASLASEMRAPSAGGKLLAESLSLSLAARIMQRFSSAGSARIPRASATALRNGDTRIQRVIDYMIAHLEDPIGLDDLASVACLSPFHFARTFRSSAAEPPHGFLSRLRLEHAKSLLKSGARTISDISLACQFSSQTNFTRAFRYLVGVTPNEFRKRA